MTFTNLNLNNIRHSWVKSINKLEKFYLDADILVSSGVKIKDIHTHMKPSELKALYQITLGLDLSSNILEVGSYLGASSCYIASGLLKKQGHEGRLFCVDTWRNETMPEGERDTMDKFIKNTSDFSSVITTIRKNSQNLSQSDIDSVLHFAFIDGDHSYKGCSNDFNKISEWLVPGGIIAFHDCRFFEGVSKTVGEAMASGKWQLCGWVENLIWLKKIDGISHDFLHKS